MTISFLCSTILQANQYHWLFLVDYKWLVLPDSEWSKSPDPNTSENMAAALLPMVKKLWPEHDIDELEKILIDYIRNREAAIFTAKVDGEYIGVALCCLRHDYVEGCETSPVGYLEGIFVNEYHRKQGIANALCKECEQWAKEIGCTEFASDCELSNTTSLQFHLRIGFTEENRIICFKKSL